MPLLHQTPLGQILQISFPLHWKKLFFLIITCLAGRNEIPLGAFATPGYGYNVIHGQLFGGRGLATIVTDALGTTSLPPLRSAQLTGLATLGFYMRLVEVIRVWTESVYHHGSPGAFRLALSMPIKSDYRE